MISLFFAEPATATATARAPAQMSPGGGSVLLYFGEKFAPPPPLFCCGACAMSVAANEFFKAETASSKGISFFKHYDVCEIALPVRFA